MNYIAILSSLIGAVIGGGFSILASLISFRHQRRLQLEMEDKRTQQDQYAWLREKKYNLYTELSKVLEAVGINIEQPDNPDEWLVDVDEQMRNLEALTSFVDTYRGEIAVLFPLQISNAILKLRSHIYKLTTCKELQRITTTDLINSPVFQLVIEAKRIGMMLREDLYFYEYDGKEKKKCES